MTTTPRDLIGLSVSGEVLEIGPGSRPFSVAPNANVRYADRSVEGGRDQNWPELIGSPPGIRSHYDLNLDLDGLSQVESGSLDGLVASHVIEHVANPLGVIAEFSRVLKVGGKLILVVPDRHRTFDAPRAPTPFSTVLAKHRKRVTEVDEASIRDFCQAIYGQPPIHPPEVREWHNPAELDASRIALHRRRSIHVHVWNPEEFAALLVSSMVEGICSWHLKAMYFSDHFPDQVADEFGLVLEKVQFPGPQELGQEFVRSWCESVLDDPLVHPVRLARFEASLHRDCTDTEISSLPLQLLAVRPVSVGIANAKARISDLEAELYAAQAQAEKASERVDELKHSTSWKVTAPLRSIGRLLQ